MGAKRSFGLGRSHVWVDSPRLGYRGWLSIEAGDGGERVMPSYLADVMSIAQTCQELHVSRSRLMSWVERDDDPMPFRLLPGSSRGAFILRDELLGWLRRNSPLLADSLGSRPRAR